MRELKENIKKYLFIKYTEAKLHKCDNKISKSIPWIQRKSLMNNIETHCKVLVNSILNSNKKQSLRQNMFIIDSIFKYTLGKSENLLKTSKKTKNIKEYMQLNSYIVFDEIQKGILENRNKKVINFNIEKQLLQIQEEVDSEIGINKILEEKIKA